jgi:hypothetical protein
MPERRDLHEIRARRGNQMNPLNHDREDKEKALISRHFQELHAEHQVGRPVRFGW